ncbi:MAG: hypothetical protein PUK67_03155 [Prevotellaceae bacterium]|nr:hypothetical protein [Prevotellaceae bacterium]MDY3364801.1 hypothetical protein [Prevotella sp.]
MENWEKFEEACFSYLKKHFANKEINFIKTGGHTSTHSDILCSRQNKPQYYIEAKMNQAQCGQFVLFPDSTQQKFIFSERNKSDEKYAHAIIDYLNLHFEEYKKPSTKAIACSSNLLSQWIINHYQEEYQVKYVITQAENGQYIIFPIERFEHYFSIIAVYRTKKSGSANPSVKDINELSILLQNNKYTNSSIMRKGKYVFAQIPNLTNASITLSGKTSSFLFKKTADNIYKITKLSNTYNANVIFSITLKQSQDIADLEHFKNSLQP